MFKNLYFLGCLFGGLGAVSGCAFSGDIGAEYM